MKYSLVGLISLISLGVTCLSFAVWSQDPCFLQGANGQSINLSSLCGDRSPQSPKKVAPKDFYQIPIKRRVAGIPTVEVVFNGKHTVEMLFDTGASVIVLNPEVARAIGIFVGKETMTTHTAGGVVESKVGYATSLQAGGLTLNNVEVSITPKLGLPGLLGQRFYGDYDVTIKKNVIELRHRPASAR
ncbi:MAG: retropepsin-like aspartic protease [Snowella sp.]|nr:retropepsin-like aspartic protease [Snowella sp.]